VKNARLALLFIAIVMATLRLAAAADPPAARAPNLVYILCDDLGYGDVHYLNPDRGKIPTPNMDRLGAQGMAFTDCHASSSVCTPSRYSILTGRYCWRTRLQKYVLDGDSPPLIAPDRLTVATLLKRHGYATAAIGKWHLGGARYYPERQGFDLNVGGTDSGSPTSHFYPQWAGNPPISAQPGSYLADVLTDAAQDFIHKNSGSPFFLYLAHYGVHLPIEAKPEMARHYQGTADPKNPQHNPVYAAMVQSIDESVGRVARTIEDEKLTGNTVFIFTSDNGGLASAEYKGQTATSNAPLKAGKGFLYEGGIREPMFVVWPGVTAPGSVSEFPVISTDFYRTIAQMAGITKLKGDPRDGVSLVPTLRRNFAPARDAIFWHYPHYSNQGGRPGAAIRLGDWKLLRWYEDNATELYNLRADPGEQKNLADTQAAKARGLDGLLDDWLHALKPEMPVPNPAYDPEQETEGLAPAIHEQLKSGELPTPPKAP
jgi:arylsulfatase A-like enzyme